MKYDIFISYSRVDSKIVLPVADFLTRNGFSVWIDRDGIESGGAFKSVRVKAIEDSCVILFFASRSANESEWTAKEIGVANKFGKHIIPVRLDNSPYNESVLFDLVNIDYVDYSDPFKRSSMLEKIVKTLQQICAKEDSPVDKPAGKFSRKIYPAVLIPVLLVAAVFVVLHLIPDKKSSPEACGQMDDANLPRFQNITVSDHSYKLVLVNGGTYDMGAQGTDPDSPGYVSDIDLLETPMHNVAVNSFYILESEVSQQLWKAVMGGEPESDGGWTEDIGKGDNYPAYRVSWDDVQAFIITLNDLTGYKFRLPTEEEWEFAARGRHSDGYMYAGSDDLDHVAWYKDNSGHQVHEIKTKQRNSLGLYDMTGNLWEWCSDVFQLYSEKIEGVPAPQNEPVTYVCRGGAWGTDRTRARVSMRKEREHFHISEYLGFRFVLPADAIQSNQ